VGLSGPLGAGKTVFAKGLAEGLGIDPASVSSPTFTIANEYDAPGGQQLAHVDFYRIGSVGELEATGFADLLLAESLVVIEWSERFPQALPADRLEIRILRPDPEGTPTARALSAVALGATAEAALARWCEALAP